MGVLVFAFVIQPLGLRSEKQNYAKAEEKIDSLSEQIQNTIGKADDIKKEKSCGFANTEIGHGELGCSISTILVYKDSDALKSTKLMHKASLLNSSPLYDIVGRSNSLTFVQNTNHAGIQSFSQSLPAPHKLNCTIRYSYQASIPSIEPKHEGLTVEQACGGPAMKQYYPINN